MWPFAGTSGRLATLLLAHDATDDLLRTSANPWSGLASEAVTALLGATDVRWLGMTGWKLDGESGKGIKVVSEGNDANAFGIVSTLRLRGGVGEWSVSVDSVYDGNPAATQSVLTADVEARFPDGAMVKFDLIQHKGSGYGRYNCFGKIVSKSYGVKMANEPQPFTFMIEGHGLLPIPVGSI